MLVIISSSLKIANVRDTYGYNLEITPLLSDETKV